jgi:type II secretory pathway pseudopilin PulG
MLVVIGILAVLMGASLGGYSTFVKKAQRVRAVELVSNVQTALESVMQREGSWPRAVLAGNNGGNGEITSEVGAALARRGVMSLTYKTTEQDGEKVYRLTGLDQCGVVSPWATAAIKRAASGGSVGDSLRVPEGGTVADHRLRYAVDDDYDGITEVSDSRARPCKVRASACVWCYGMDGKPGTKDDVYSWSAEQEVR